MTRKYYDRDYEGEALQYAYGNDDTESEEEEEEVDDYDPWDDIQYYIDSELSFGTNADWIGKWFDATDIIKIIEGKYLDDYADLHIAEYLFPYETNTDVNDLLDHMWNLHDICRIEPDLCMLYSAVLELLAERTKYYYVNDFVSHRTIVTKNFFQKGKRSNDTCTNSQISM